MKSTTKPTTTPCEGKGLRAATQDPVESGISAGVLKLQIVDDMPTIPADSGRYVEPPIFENVNTRLHEQYLGRPVRRKSYKLVDLSPPKSEFYVRRNQKTKTLKRNLLREGKIVPQGNPALPDLNVQCFLFIKWWRKLLEGDYDLNFLVDGRILTMASLDLGFNLTNPIITNPLDTEGNIKIFMALMKAVAKCSPICAIIVRRINTIMFHLRAESLNAPAEESLSHLIAAKTAIDGLIVEGSRVILGVTSEAQANLGIGNFRGMFTSSIRDNGDTLAVDVDLEDIDEIPLLRNRGTTANLNVSFNPLDLKHANTVEHRNDQGSSSYHVDFGDPRDHEEHHGCDCEACTSTESSESEELTNFDLIKGVYKQYRDGTIDTTIRQFERISKSVQQSVRDMESIVNANIEGSNLKELKDVLSNYKTGDLKDFSESLERSLDKASSLLDKLPLNDVKDIKNYIINLLNTSSKGEDPVPESSSESSTVKYLFYLTLVAFTGCATMAVRDRSLIYIVLTVVLGGVLLYYFDITGFVGKYRSAKTAVDYLSNFLNMVSEFGNPQAQFLDSDVEQACSSIGTLFTFYLLKDTPHSKLASEIYSKVSGWERFTGNLTSVIKHVIEMVNRIYNYVVDVVAPDDEGVKYSRWMKSSNPEIEEFVKESQEFCDKYYASKLHFTEVNHDKLKDLIKKGQALMLSLNRGKLGTAPMVMQQIFHQLLKINEKFSQHDWNSMGTRIEPVWLLFIGAAGNGKSIVSRKMTHYIIGHLLPDDVSRELFIQNCDQYIFYRKAGMEFWEGYMKSTIAVVQDDILQTPDVQGSKVSEPLEVIHGMNTEPLILNMAFEGKGHMYLGARLWSSSTNTLKPTFETITHRQAYYRRCRNAYMVVPKDHVLKLEDQGVMRSPGDYMTLKVDKEKLPLDEDGETVLDETCVDFIRVHYSDDGKVTYGERVDYHQVIKETLVDLRRKEAQFNKHCAELKRERERGVRDYYAFQASLRPEGDTSDMQADVKPEIYTETRFLEKYLDDFSYLPPSDYHCEKDPEKFTKVDNDRIKSIVDACKDTRNVPAFRFYLIALHFYRKWNDWNVPAMVSIEEVITAYYVRFGDRFWDLYESKDSIKLEEMCIYIVRNQPKFDRRYANVVFPHHPIAKWIELKAYISKWKQHLYEKYVKGSWFEKFQAILGEVYEANPFYFKFMGVIFLLNVVSTVWNSYFAVPSINKLIDKNEELKETRLQNKKITEDAIESENRLVSILNKEMELLKSQTETAGSTLLIDTLVKNILDSDEYTSDEKVRMISILHEQVVTETKAQSAPVKLRDRKKKAKLKLKEARPRKEKEETTENQGAYGIDPNGDEIITAIVNNNCYELMLKNSPEINTHTRIGTITFMKYNYASVLKHFANHVVYNMMKWDEVGKDYLDELVILRQCGEISKVVHKCKLRDFVDIKIVDDEVSFPMVSIPETVDNVILKINIQNLNMGPRRDIIKHVATKKQYMALPENCPGAVVLPGADKDVVMPISNLITRSSYPNVYSDSLGNKYAPHYMMEYKAKTVVGTCGGLAVLDTRQSGAVRIYGFHTSGVTENCIGFSEAVFRENIVDAIDCFDNRDTITLPLDTTQNQANTMIADGQFSPLYKLKRPLPANYETSYKKSKLSGIFFPPKEMPAIMKPHYIGDKRVDPWEENLKKFPKESPVVDPKIIGDICDQIFVDLMQASHVKVKPRVLTLEEAVLGEDEFGLGSMPRDTSPGYKYLMDPVPGLPKSYRFFGRDPEGYDLDNPYYRQLEKDVELYQDQLAVGFLDPAMYVSDNLKDECLPKEKVLGEGKCRIFNSFIMDSKAVQKMQYGAFGSWINKNRISNGIAIGVNPYAEWDEVAKYLMVFGDEHTRNIKAGDYKRFDMSQIIIILVNIHERIILKWYGLQPDSREAKIKRSLFWTLICSQKLRIDLVYECNGGLPSGCWLTPILNSLYNKFNSYYVWYRFHDFKISCLPIYKFHVRIIVLGDDILTAISQFYNDQITDIYMSEALKEIGMTYTLETKDTMRNSARCITEVEFLKRSFRKDIYSGRWVAPIRLDCTLETLYWTRKRPEADQITRQNVDFVLKELALHGRGIFMEYAPIIAKHSYDRLDYYSDFQNYFVAYDAIFNSSGYF